MLRVAAVEWDRGPRQRWHLDIGGFPAGAIALVLGVDRILDMCRTMVNVTADLTTAIYVAKSEPEESAIPEPPLDKAASPAT